MRIKPARSVLNDAFKRTPFREQVRSVMASDFPAFRRASAILLNSMTGSTAPPMTINDGADQPTG
jgi:hypothetical protein